MSVDFEKHKHQIETDPNRVRCAHCGAWVEARADRCHKCGVRFKGEAFQFTHASDELGSERDSRRRRLRVMASIIALLFIAGVIAFFATSCARDKMTVPGPETVLVHLKLAGGAEGTPEEQTAMRALAKRLDAKAKQSKAGKFETATYRDGECVLILYGPSADSLDVAIEPELRASTLSHGGWVIKRYGDAQNRNARTARVDL